MRKTAGITLVAAAKVAKVSVDTLRIYENESDCMPLQKKAALDIVYELMALGRALDSVP